MPRDDPGDGLVLLALDEPERPGRVDPPPVPSTFHDELAVVTVLEEDRHAAGTESTGFTSLAFSLRINFPRVCAVWMRRTGMRKRQVPRGWKCL
jgi:hypothetical protein